MNQATLLDLIQRLYAAPGTSAGWPAFLEALRVSTSASSANLLAHSPMHRVSDIAAAAGASADREAAALYERQWSGHDPWAYSPRFSPQSGTVFRGDHLVPHDEFLRTPFYADFGRAFDIVRAVGATIEASPSGISVITLNGSESRQPFAVGETTLLATLMPHMQQALRLHRRLVDAEDATGDLAAIIERSTRAVILVGPGGKVTFMNAAASRLVARHDGVTVEHGELRASNPATTARLRALIAQTVQTSSGEGIGAGGILPLGRPSGRRALTALVCAVSAENRLRAHSAAVLVSITDPEVKVLPDEATLRELFGLTPAEAKLTRMLAEGESLSTAATRLGLSRETARTRIKVIFEKTATHRQAELVGLVSRVAAQV